MVNQLMEEAWRKANSIKAANKRSIQNAKRFVQYANDPVGFAREVLKDTFPGNVVKVMESVRDCPVTIARSANGVGKSYSAARIAVWYYLVYPDAQIYITAAPPLENLKSILWGQIMGIVEKNPHLFQYDKIKALQISRGSKSFIKGVAIPTSGTSEQREAKFSGKHAPHMLFIVDEGDAVPEEVYKGIESCMSGVNHRLLIMFNPRAPLGPVYLKEINHQANIVGLSAFDHPNVITGENIYPGAVARETTVRRLNEWTRELAENEKPDFSCFEVPDFLVGATATALNGIMYEPLEPGLRKITEPSFSYMVLGQYPPQSETQLISQVWIDNARQRYDEYVKAHGETPPAGEKLTIGVDIAEFGGDRNVACLRYGSWVAPLKWWKGLDPDQSSDHILRIYRENSANIVMIDATGPGAGVAPSVARRGREEDVRAVAVKVASRPSPIIKSEQGEFQILRDQLWWAAREWLRTDPNAMLPNDRMLLEELRTPTYSVPNGKIKVMNKDTMREMLRRSPDRADAFCMTFAPFARATVTRLVSQ